MSSTNRPDSPRTPLIERRHHVGVLATTTILLFLVVVGRAEATTWFVADTGTDAAGCGTLSTTPCRSITQAIANAIAGDTITVAPGRYGDLNRNGTLGDTGEENGSAGCSCVLVVDKAVIVISSGGAARTMIDGRKVNVVRNVMIADDGVEFGRPGKGFTVTETEYNPSAVVGRNYSDGIVIAANSVMVRGNQLLFRTETYNVSFGKGIHTGNQLHSVRLEGNLVTGWITGIDGGSGVTVSKNQVLSNGYGIEATGGSVVGNVVTNNSYGILIDGSPQVTSNAFYANRLAGIYVRPTFSGVVTKNNFFGNDDDSNCGLINGGMAGLQVTNNYWGAPTGPGGPPANTVCHPFGGTTTTSPFATKPFAVQILKP